MTQACAVPDAADFLQRYWQKHPCLLRQAAVDFRSFIGRQELFALAGRDEVESRLVLETSGEYPWQVLHGPFSEADFAALSAEQWTLLVQNVDLHLSAAAVFLDRFAFIPDWRVDDLMISYAPVGGSVGPHLDSYDVFLFQAEGRRRWTINAEAYDDGDFIDGLDLRIIGNFKGAQEWILEPGDMLYLPPGVAHHGVALEDSLTYSIGFRAPSDLELLYNYLDELPASAGERRYRDPDLLPAVHRAEIKASELDKITALFRSRLPDTAHLSTWFGRFVTRLPDTFELDPAPTQLDTNAFAKTSRERPGLVKHPATRCVFIRQAGHFELFVNGEAYRLPLTLEKFIVTFSENRDMPNPLAAGQAGVELAELLRQLYNRGIIMLQRD